MSPNKYALCRVVVNYYGTVWEISTCMRGVPWKRAGRVEVQVQVAVTLTTDETKTGLHRAKGWDENGNEDRRQSPELRGLWWTKLKFDDEAGRGVVHCPRFGLCKVGDGRGLSTRRRRTPETEIKVKVKVEIKIESKAKAKSRTGQL